MKTFRKSTHGLSRFLCSCALVTALLFSGCPRRFDPRADEIHSASPELESEYRKAEQLLRHGELQAADEALRGFLTKYAVTAKEDPLLPVATLLSARCARVLGQPARARDLAQPLLQGTGNQAPWIVDRAKLELGLAQYRLGELTPARNLLASLADQIVDSDDATELHATLADLWLRDNNPSQAARQLELFFAGQGVSPLEQTYVREQVQLLLPRLPQSEQQRLRQRLGLSEAGSLTQAANPADSRLPHAVVGLVLPLTGKSGPYGDRILKGGLWAADLLGKAPTSGMAPANAGFQPLASIELLVRNSVGADIASVVKELSGAGVTALIGPPARTPEAAQLAEQAERQGMVVLSLSPATGGTPSVPAGTRTFQLVRSNAARAQGLARTLIRSGLTTVAVVAPTTAYGQAMTKAFTEILAGSQVRVISQQTFEDGAQTFTGLSAELLAKQPAALFVPAAANQLELIASQLAASGVLPIYKVSRGTADKPGLANPPVKLLLASAEGMGSRLLKNAGRYLQGAVLAPLSSGGLQLSANDQATIQAGPWAAHWEDYAAQVGAEVGVLDALGFEAVRLVQTACGQVQSPASSGARNSCTSQQLASKLQTLRVEGSTGPIAFDAQGQRTGEPLLLQVDGNILRPLR